MALTVTNVNTLTLLNILNRNSEAQKDVLTRLSTGTRINKGSDDPAGLIALRSLEGELSAVDAGIANNQRTDAILNVADKALGEVTSLLKEIQKLSQQSVNAAALTPDELAANQQQIDNAIESIDRIISTTEFNGKKLLDGSQAINFSGADLTKVSDIQVFGRNADSTSTALSITVSAAAEKASYVVASAAAGSALSLSLQGKDGSVVIDIASGASISTVAGQIDASTGQTGIDAVASSDNKLYLRSSEYGSASFVRATVISGNSSNTYVSGNDSGADATVTVNGQSAAVNGLNVTFSSNGASVSFNLTESFSQATGSTSLTITDGGATFQLGTESETRATIGINGLATTQLGSSVNGYLSSLKSGGANTLINDPNKAAQIAGSALNQLAKFQGRVGAFQKFQVKTALNSLTATKAGLETARSIIADVDYAAETSELNRQNVLLQTSISLLGLANQQSSQILSLLR